jgi:hypothetical protein
MDIEAELNVLKRRMDAVEEIVNILAGQFRALQPEIAALASETVRRFDAADSLMARIVNRLDTVNTQVWSLRDDLPLLFHAVLDERQPRSPNGQQD